MSSPPTYQINSGMTPNEIQLVRENATRQLSQIESEYLRASTHRGEYTPESYQAYEDSAKANIASLRRFISEDSLAVLRAAYNKTNLSASAGGSISPLKAGQTFGEFEEHLYQTQPKTTKYVVNYEENGQNLSVAFSDPDKAQRFAEGLNEHNIRATQLSGEKAQLAFSRADQSFNADELASQPYFVDAPGMESYVASLNIPNTKSGYRSQGVVDAKIDEVATSIKQFGYALEKGAASTKLRGDNIFAGAQASAAIALGSASLAFDATLGLLNVNPKQAADSVYDFAEHPLFTTGYVAAEGGLIALGLSDVANYSASKLPKSTKEWLRSDSGFIDVAHESMRTPKLPKPPNIDSNYWASKPVELYPTAYEGVVPETLWIGDKLYFQTGADLYEASDAITDIYRTSTASSLKSVRDSMFFRMNYPSARRIATPLLTQDVAISLLGVANLSKGIFRDNQRIADAVKAEVTLSQKAISETVITRESVPETIPILDPISVTLETTKTVPLTRAPADVESTAITLVTPEVALVSGENASTLELAPVSEATPRRSESTRDEGRGKALKLPDSEPSKTSPRGESPHNATRFHVVLDGRVSTVEASGFVEALQRVSGGRGSRATVTRLG